MHREDLRNPAGGQLEGLRDLDRPRRGGSPGKRQDQADQLREDAQGQAQAQEAGSLRRARGRRQADEDLGTPQDGRCM